jgi:S-DNA-T family DNA segregation ATPase FtsK/SpoIIIE
VLGRDPDCDVVLADPSLSRRHMELEIATDAVWIRDLGSRNGTAVEGRALAEGPPLSLREGDHIEVGRSVLTFTRATAPRPRLGTLSNGATPFNRPPRIRRPYRPPQLSLEPAPGEVTRARLQVGAAVLPVLLGVSSALLLRQPAMLLSMLLSPLTLIWSYVSDRRSGARTFRRSMARYTERLAILAEELERASSAETVVRRSAAPDAAELIARAVEMRPELWERRPSDADFLALRLGVTDRPAEFTVRDDPGAQAVRPAATQELLDAYRSVPMVPVVVDLPAEGSLGLVGPDRRVDGLGLWLALQTIVLHSPREVVLRAAIDLVRAEQWEWLKWAPHVRASARAGHDGEVRLAQNANVATRLQEQLAELVTTRHDEARERPPTAASSFAPAVVLFLDEDLVYDRALAGEIMERGPAVRVYTVWLGHIQRGLPGECGSIAQLDRDIARLTVMWGEQEEEIADVAADAVEPDLALEAARALASVRDIGARAAPASSPRVRPAGVSAAVNGDPAVAARAVAVAALSWREEDDAWLRRSRS